MNGCQVMNTVDVGGVEKNDRYLCFDYRYIDFDFVGCMGMDG